MIVCTFQNNSLSESQACLGLKLPCYSHKSFYPGYYWYFGHTINNDITHFNGLKLIIISAKSNMDGLLLCVVILILECFADFACLTKHLGCMVSFCNSMWS